MGFIFLLAVDRLSVSSADVRPACYTHDRILWASVVEARSAKALNRNLRVMALESSAEQSKSPGALPTGTVTFLFSDIEGSTQKWESFRDAMKVAVSRHERVMKDAVARQSGFVFKTVGDAFCVAFPTSSLVSAVWASILGSAAPSSNRAANLRHVSKTQALAQNC